MANVPRKPRGNDPRLALGSAELEAASKAAYPQVAGKTSKLDFGMLAIVAAALGIGVVTWITLTAHTSPTAQPATRARVANPVIHLQSSSSPVTAPASLPLTILQGGPLYPRAVSSPPASDDSHAPVMIIDNSVPSAEGPPNKAAADAAQQGSAALLDPNEQFAARVGAADENTSSRIADPAHTIPQGAVIPAVLETALNSDLPGFARAIVSRDIKGFDGSVVLVPRGSRLIGQYKSNLSSGVKRMYVIWERLLRPDGVSIQLGSPATDEIGQAGIAGEVDTHFLKRFGAAMLLSVVTGLSTSNSGTAIVIGSGGAQSAATDALGVDAKIPPTITVEQGTVIQVFVARDLHFGE
jgi:type IV secretion system protein VirB10